MAHPEATAKLKVRPHPGGILDPAMPSHRWWVAATVMLKQLFGGRMSQIGHASRTAPDYDGLWARS